MNSIWIMMMSTSAALIGWEFCRVRTNSDRALPRASSPPASQRKVASAIFRHWLANDPGLRRGRIAVREEAMRECDPMSPQYWFHRRALAALKGDTP